MIFSIVIPVYNVAPYLRECLDSVVAAVREVEKRGGGGQRTVPVSVEVICADDGSTDGSGAILDTYASNFNLQPSTFNFRVLHQKNAGVGAARNAGLEMATGDYFLFVDSDDVIRDSLLADVADVLCSRPDIPLVGFGLRLFVTGEPKWDPRLGCEMTDIDLREEIPDLMAMLSAYRFVYRRADFADLRFRSYSRGEDLVYVAEALARANACVYICREEYGYRNRPGSAVHIETNAKDAITAIAFHEDMFRTLAASTKRLGPDAWNLRLEQWVLRLPIEILRHAQDPAWACAWNRWVDSMSVAIQLPYLQGGLRFVVRLALKRPGRLIMLLACRIGVRLSRLRR